MDLLLLPNTPAIGTIPTFIASLGYIILARVNFIVA